MWDDETVKYLKNDFIRVMRVSQPSPKRAVPSANIGVDGAPSVL